METKEMNGPIKMILGATLAMLLAAGSANAFDAKSLDFGGQVRLRGETTDIQSYATPGLRRGQDFMLLRTRLHGSAQPAHGVKAFLQAALNF
jgi:hypothetical protein